LLLSSQISKSKEVHDKMRAKKLSSLEMKRIQVNKLHHAINQLQNEEL